MDNKNTTLPQEVKKLKTKFTFWDHVKLTYSGLSFFSVMIFAEAPFWLLFLIVANFGVAAAVSNTIEWPVEYDKDGNIIDPNEA